LRGTKIVFLFVLQVALDLTGGSPGVMWTPPSLLYLSILILATSCVELSTQVSKQLPLITQNFRITSFYNSKYCSLFAQYHTHVLVFILVLYCFLFTASCCSRTSL